MAPQRTNTGSMLYGVLLQCSDVNRTLIIQLKYMREYKDLYIRLFFSIRPIYLYIHIINTPIYNLKLQDTRKSIGMSETLIYLFYILSPLCQYCSLPPTLKTSFFLTFILKKPYMMHDTKCFYITQAAPLYF